MKAFADVVYKMLVAVILFVVPFCVHAQGEGADVNIDLADNTGVWYTNPVVWLVAATAFVLLLIIVLRGRKTPRN